MHNFETQETRHFTFVFPTEDGEYKFDTNALSLLVAEKRVRGILHSIVHKFNKSIREEEKKANIKK